MQQLRRFTILLAPALLAACGLATQAAPPDVSAKPNPDPARFTADIAAFEAWDRQNSAPKDAVLFVGSSSIRMWQTAESFPDLAVINRGFGGSHASDVNHFAERIVLKYAPRTIVFYAGDNDLADGKSPEQVAGDFEQFVDIVHAKLPDTRDHLSPGKAKPRPLAALAEDAGNKCVGQKVCRRQRAFDIRRHRHADARHDGRPRPEIFLDDGLHMNADGYKIWTELLRRQLTAH